MLSKIISSEIILLIIYFIVFFAINSWIVIHFRKQEIIDNWDKYRFKLWVMPFAGILNPNAESSQNFSEMLWGSIKPVFALLTKPLTYITQIMGKIIDKIKGVIDKFRAQIAIIRNLIFKIIAKAMKKIENIMSTSIFAFAKINEMTKRQLAIFQNIVYILEVSSVAMSSFTKGAFLKLIDFSEVAIWVLPTFLLGPAGLVFPIMATCFSPNTPIKLDNGNIVKISEIKIGDNVFGGGKVTSIIKTLPLEPVYTYDGICVSGSHLVLENGKWTKIRDCKKSKRIDYNGYLLNLNTTKNIIPIETHLFKDYDEYTNIDQAVNENNSVLIKLNGNITNLKQQNAPKYKIGISENAKINGKYISEIYLGDKNLGIIKHMVEPTDILYKYRGIIMSCWQKVFYKGRWLNIADVSGAKRIYKTNQKYLYSIITGDNIIRLDNGLVLRDFVEISH